MRSASCFESSKLKKEEMRDDRRVGSKLRSVDHDGLHDGESHSIPDLGQQPFCNHDGGPTERGQPTEHRDGGCSQITDR